MDSTSECPSRNQLCCRSGLLTSRTVRRSVSVCGATQFRVTCGSPKRLVIRHLSIHPCTCPHIHLSTSELALYQGLRKDHWGPPDRPGLTAVRESVCGEMESDAHTHSTRKQVAAQGLWEFRGESDLAEVRISAEDVFELGSCMFISHVGRASENRLFLASEHARVPAKALPLCKEQNKEARRRAGIICVNFAGAHLRAGRLRQARGLG